MKMPIKVIKKQKKDYQDGLKKTGEIREVKQGIKKKEIFIDLQNE